MKINYNNTALGLIDDPDNFHFGFPDPDITPKLTPKELKEFGNSLIASSDTIKTLCGNNIEYISGSFFDAFKNAMPKLKSLVFNEEIEESGILITGGFDDGYTHMHTIYYTVCTIKYDDDDKLFYNVLFMDFSKHSKAEECALDVYVTCRIDFESKEIETKKVIWNGYLEEGRTAEFWQSFIISFCLFKKYCEIETKVIDPKVSRREKVAGKKYLNETNKRIKILDATWFTNIVVSGAFGVSGHLRWQRYGPGNTQKKLIWIDEFQKEGYIRKAKAITNGNHN